MIRYRLAELSPEREHDVAAHLSVCGACRLEMHRLSTASPAVGISETESLQALMARIRGWEAGPSVAERTGEALKQRVAGELELYVGKQAAQSILQPVGDDGRNLLSSVSPLLTMFLGRRATERLVSHVVEHAIVRI